MLQLTAQTPEFRLGYFEGENAFQALLVRAYICWEAFNWKPSNILSNTSTRPSSTYQYG